MSNNMSNVKRKPFTLAEAEAIGNKLGINWEKFAVKQFRLGMNAELADGTYNPYINFASDDPIKVGKVVRAHLNENPDYYTEWAELERETEHGHSAKHTTTSVGQ